MSRQYNDHSEPVDYPRRSNQPYETAPQYASRESPRAYPMSRTSPDQGSDKGEQQPRRRIGLAVRNAFLPLKGSSVWLTEHSQCSRCRKRKIKCSGDIAGLGCQNCKNAGAEECNFLRVRRGPGRRWFCHAHSQSRSILPISWPLPPQSTTHTPPLRRRAYPLA